MLFNLIIFFSLGFVIIFSTFFITYFPFISFFTDLSSYSSFVITYSNSLFSIGYFQSNLQIPVVILVSLLLNPYLNFIFMLSYLILGFFKYPIFYYGGGMDYIQQDSVGYILSFLPVSIMISNLAWRKNRQKYLFNTKYLFSISILGLILIHLIGMGILFIRFNFSNFSDFLRLAQIYFFIPILSQVMLVYVFTIFSVLVNRFKFFIFENYNMLISHKITNEKSTKP